ncbi:cytochrome c biogenesis protein CcsA [Fulvivirgaceae bacterium BMA12]|uniref:Cytochrome c biogenesis protein CcsA n=1 Tax=Agaribacillus aureus TaxID=3051825 RepID=A0ABT8LD44_9BACT|nr:cytochrome c biogenesis protein CcsA [Fulvivirgaceae bacterium BMA12]
MVHSFVGNLGHLLIIVAFVSSILAAATYFFASSDNPLKANEWRLFARMSFFVHAVAVFATVYCLFHIISNYYYEYHYPWKVSDRNLPFIYKISSLWQDQEGSFLLWIFWDMVLGLVIIFTNKYWEAPVMTIFALVQAFLTSMILGVVIPGINLKIGSDPFILLRDVFYSDEIFRLNPNFVPADGTGLNPLLQNYWMAIHPPTLFLGFATTLVPFAYCIAGLWKKRYTEWIRPALPWSLFSAVTLGTGILMGGYWAYETLNFEGFWNWDPVENASLVPWLTLVASYHTMIAYRNSTTALKTAVILIVVTFILVLYSTFLTRSGVLGDASVHSFTDLGLSGQLLIYLLAFMVLSVFLIIIRWKDIPAGGKEVSTYSREFWIFMGATTLCLMAFQVIVATSIPVFNEIIEWFGGIGNIAAPSDPASFYSSKQLWFAIFLAIFSGTGQFFWWKKMEKEKLKAALTYPFVITLVLAGLVIVVAKVKDFSYILLLTASIYSAIANGSILIKLLRSNINLAGGSIAHIGIAMMLIGILFSTGYSKVVSINKSGLKIFADVEEEFNLENIVLFLNQSQKMEPYDLTYKGRRLDVKGVPGYVDFNDLGPTEDRTKAIALDDISVNGKVYANKGDTVKIHPENIYFQVDYVDKRGKNFSLFPRMQINESMGNVSSPDIKRYLTKDLYTHLNYAPYLTPEDQVEWSDPETHTVKLGQRFFINDFVTILDKVERVENVAELGLNESDLAVRASISIFSNEGKYTIEPLYIIRERMLGRVPETLQELGIQIIFSKIDPQTNEFTFEVRTTQRDFIVLKAVQKPGINVLWTGTMVMILGFIIAIRRRYREFIKMRNKGTEL